MYSIPLPVHLVAGCAVAAQPGDIDVTNASMVSDTLLALLNRGTPGVVADMTACGFCDAAGARAVVQAHRRAQALGAWFGVVIPHPAARRVFTITGADSLIRIYPSLAQALAARREATAGQRAGRRAPAREHPTGQPGASTRAHPSRCGPTGPHSPQGGH
jgi:anti-anti-sigma factor